MARVIYDILIINDHLINELNNSLIFKKFLIINDYFKTNKKVNSDKNNLNSKMFVPDSFSNPEWKDLIH